MRRLLSEGTQGWHALGFRAPQAWPPTAPACPVGADEEGGLTVEQDIPAGWKLQKGAGGWRCVNRARLWSTNVYRAADGGAAKAVEAAETLEREAGKTIAARERLCEDLRRCFRGES